jgi:hypothetical protein
MSKYIRLGDTVRRRTTLLKTQALHTNHVIILPFCILDAEHCLWRQIFRVQEILVCNFGPFAAPHALDFSKYAPTK